MIITFAASVSGQPRPANLQVDHESWTFKDGALNTLGHELAGDKTSHNSTGPTFHVAVGGAPRDLTPAARDEVYRIAGEALRNAYGHADAQHIEMEIRYEHRQFRLRWRDDGKGIDPKVLSDDGHQGHYGLRGMRERATLLGGTLTVWSERNPREPMRTRHIR